MTEAAPIEGHCDARFEPVRDALAANFRERDELGAAVTIVIEGRTVVDLWGGWMDEQRTRPWTRNTLVDVFSVGKAMATICVLMLAERGQLTLDAPVARYWPEFAANGKAETTVAMILSHRAGLPGIRQPLADEAIYEPDTMAKVLAGEQPWWTPGEAHGYHVNTFGFLLAEIVRRVSTVSIGEFFQREVAAPLDVQFRFGTQAADDERTADYLFGDETVRISEREAPGMEQIYLNPPGISGLGTVNTRKWRAAQMPSTNGHATARAVARIYAALDRLLSKETIELAVAEASSGPDLVLGRPSRFGLGFQLTQPERQLGPNPNSFGHFGAGGSLGFFDPDAKLAFAYTMNRSGPRWQNPRNRALLEAAYRCV